MRFAGFLLGLAMAGMMLAMASSVLGFIRDDIRRKDWAELGGSLLMLTVMLCMAGVCGTMALVAIGVIE